MEDGLVTVNVGGRLFQTRWKTLQNVPGTRLAKLTTNDSNYIRKQKMFFFDRNPDFFASILDFYRCGELHFDHCKCGPAIRRELEYWGIDENCVSSCCWQSYIQYEEDKITIAKLEDAFTRKEDEKGLDPELPTTDDRRLSVPDVISKSSSRRSNSPSSLGSHRTTSEPSFKTKVENCWSRFKNAVWMFLERPESSKGATIWSFVFFALIIISISIVIMETHPAFRVPNSDNVTTPFNLTQADERIRLFSETVAHPALNTVDGICITIFTIEIFLRFVCSPSKLKFFKSWYSLIDIFCVLPLLVYYVAAAIEPSIFTSLISGSKVKLVILMIYLSLSSVLRVFRLFKLARHYRALKILNLALASSLKELSLLLLLIFIGTLIFSTLVYFAEYQVDGKFEHIPIGFWWSTITMTTVGYGDMTPQGTWGYIVGIICAISGMLITGLPIPIIANNFNRYYTYARLTMQINEKLKKEKKLWKGEPEIVPGSVCNTGVSVRDSGTHLSVKEQRQLSNGHVVPYDALRSSSQSTLSANTLIVGSSKREGSTCSRTISSSCVYQSHSTVSCIPDVSS